jgi:hypothetical protein
VLIPPAHAAKPALQPGVLALAISEEVSHRPPAASLRHCRGLFSKESYTGDPTRDLRLGSRARP